MLAKLTFFIIRTSVLYFFKIIFTIFTTVSYVKIMINYDDFKILSPEKMDIVAKKYFQELKNIRPDPLFDNPQCTSHLDILLEALCVVQTEIMNLSNFCTRKFFSLRRVQIEKILGKISQMVKNFPQKKYTPKARNYCNGITFSIQHLCSAIKNSLKCGESHEIIKDCLDLITMLTGLLGECKYRY